MQSDSGTFSAALDADSEGVDGKFYAWTPEQVKTLLSADIYTSFAYKYGLDKSANFEGQWHLHAYHSNQAVAKKFDVDLTSFETPLHASHQTLLDVRNRRIRPGLDNKILTAWNALVIQGLAISARIFCEPDYYQLSQRCLTALCDECWHDGRLLALSRHSGKYLSAYLDDYAHLLTAIIDSLQYQWRTEDVEFAIILADQLLEFFEDSENGGFYFTAGDHENLIQRPKSWQDEAMPCGNAVASVAINRLGVLLGNRDYIHSAEKALQSVASNLNQTPLYGAGFLSLLDEISNPPCSLIVRGETHQLELWRDQLATSFSPRQSAFFIPSDVVNLPEVIAAKKTDGKTTAWICRGFTCQPPITDLDILISNIAEPTD
jgi:uncharacterized protein YyaL (SSP411 family)